MELDITFCPENLYLIKHKELNGIAAESYQGIEYILARYFSHLHHVSILMFPPPPPRSLNLSLAVG
jgi:hypothetical protein